MGKLITFYDQKLFCLGYLPKNEAEGGRPLDHARWMLIQMSFKPFVDTNKANRWLGFVQGLLYQNCVFALSELREQTREAMSE